jgi:transcriptional regulator NrdR family protein
MKCPACEGDDSKVIETRRDAGAAYRRHRCVCGEAFWTQEIPIERPPKHIAQRRIEPLKALNALRRKEAA